MVLEPSELAVGIRSEGDAGWRLCPLCFAVWLAPDRAHCISLYFYGKGDKFQALFSQEASVSLPGQSCQGRDRNSSSISGMPHASANTRSESHFSNPAKHVLDFLSVY